jgi:hypothetical protein
MLKSLIQFRQERSNITANEKLAHLRLSVLQPAEALGNVTETCPCRMVHRNIQACAQQDNDCQSGEMLHPSLLDETIDKLI